MSSELTRAEVQRLADAVGRAREALVQRLGDSDRNPGCVLALERVLARLRGSTLSHDDGHGLGLTLFAPKGAGDDARVGLGIANCRLYGRTLRARDFPAIPEPTDPQIPAYHWGPNYYGPPSPEGWGRWEYNAWAEYTPFTADPQRPDYVLPERLTAASEPSSGGGRSAFHHPVRWTGSAYQRVPFFTSARWLSLRNSTGSAIAEGTTGRVRVTVAPDDVAGALLTDAAAGDAPRDLRAYSLPYLITRYDDAEARWEPLPGNATVAVGTRLTALNMTITPSESAPGFFDLIIDLPAEMAEWPDGSEWHVALYWGTVDAEALAEGDASDVSLGEPLENIAPYLWPRKNFFRRDAQVGWVWRREDGSEPPVGLSDAFTTAGTPYLVARKRTHFAFYDGQYSSPQAPKKYMLGSWPAAPDAASWAAQNTLIGYLPPPPPGVAYPCLLLARTTGSGAAGQTELSVAVGAGVNREFWPTSEDWSRTQFPPVPEDQVVVARFVAVRAPKETDGLSLSDNGFDGGLAHFLDFRGLSGGGNGGFTRHTAAIIWLERTVPAHALPPVGDALLAEFVLPQVMRLAERLRSLGATEPFSRLAFSLLAWPIGVFPTAAPTRESMASSTSMGSRQFRRIVKQPLDENLLSRPDGESIALPFSAPARNLLTDLAGAAPSTELLRLDADAFYLTGQRLPLANTLEIYQEPAPSCTRIDQGAQGAGSRVGYDYVFRLTLEDADQNTLVKDWPIMASRYYLSPDEVKRRERQGLPMAGYFTDQTLAAIEDWRLQRYAALVPNLSMGLSRMLTTRMVSPPGGGLTREQFINQLKASDPAISDEEIREEILQFYEAGGEFYIEDESRYPNLFVAVRSAALSITTYTPSETPTWREKLSPVTVSDPDTGDPVSNVAALYSDSFIVAPTGAAAGDFEQPPTESASATVYPTSGMPPDSEDVAFAGSWLAVRLTPGTTATVGEAVVSLRVSTADAAAQGGIEIALYTEDPELEQPGRLVVTGGIVAYTELTTTRSPVRVNLPCRLEAGDAYWLVMRKTAPLFGAALFVGGDTSSGADGVKTLAGRLGDEDAAWETVASRRVGVRLLSASLPPLGAFNRSDWQVTQHLPGPNRARDVVGNRVNGWWSFTTERLPVARQLALYPRSVFDPTADSGNGAWIWLSPHTAYYVKARLWTAAGIADVTVTVEPSDAPGPIVLGDVPATGIAYLAVSLSEEEIAGWGSGAPPGDRLVLRSS